MRSSSRRRLTRGALSAVLALFAVGVLAGGAQAAKKPVRAPHLPAGFRDTFTSRFIHAGGLRQHVVIGGHGPPLLLVHGWPENWYAWRQVMPALAKNFEVIAVDQRGMGLSGKPRHGYDTRTLANDLVALMDALGHKRFAVVGHDTGMPISYALAADHPDRVARLVVAEAVLPGVAPSPPLFLPPPITARFFHLMFNQLAELNVQLVRGREGIFFGYEFDIFAARKLPADVVRYYVNGFASSRKALSGSFGFYREFSTSIAQNEQRKARRLTMPVLAIGGSESLGEAPAETMRLAADDVQSAVIPGAGHWLAEEAPQETLAALTSFLAPYRGGPASTHRRTSAKRIA
jgi:pimeloyl-ACP methyl ester carboxylesterase